MSSADPMPLEIFVDNVGVASGGGGAGARSSRATPTRTPIMVDAFPWVKDHLLRKMGAVVRKPGPKRRQQLQVDNAAALDDEAIADVWAMVRAIRQEWQRTHGDEESVIEHFRLEQREGAWTARHKKVPMDCCRGVPATEVGRLFLDIAGLSQSFSCNFQKYGRHNAELLCHAWCHRMSYMCRLWEKAGQESSFELTEGMMNNYQEPEEMSIAAADWAPATACAQRLSELRRSAWLRQPSTPHVKPPLWRTSGAP